MEQLVITLKDESKLPFLMQLIKQLDFVDVEIVRKKKNTPEYDFFKSAGLMASREIDAENLRKQAWERKK